ncbi:Mut7-C RNAse domain-containing protein [Chloroflexota bacterium]
MRLISAPKFIVDHNVGKLAKWLRMMGYDALFFNGSDDSSMIATALAEERVPPYVFQTQSQYMECPACHRIYWRGTRWQAMTEKLEKYMRV